MTNHNQIKYVAYYRVSTQKQGASGLGLESQKSQVINAIGQNTLLAEFTEIESGKKDNRVELNKAILLAKKQGATLIIAKLDRLSRDAAFLHTLAKQNINIQALDIPNLNTLTLGIYATIAQNERETISKRTKDALKAKKERELLTNPNFKHGAKNISELGKKNAQNAIEGKKRKAKENINNLRASSHIKLLLAQGLNYNQIKNELNEKSFFTSKGGQFSITQVQRLAK